MRVSTSFILYLFLTQFIYGQKEMLVSKSELQYMASFIVNDLMTICESGFYLDPFYYKELNTETSYLILTKTHIPDFDSINRSLSNYYGKDPKINKFNSQFKDLKLFSQLKVKPIENKNLKFTMEKKNNDYLGIVNISEVYSINDNYFIHVTLDTENKLGLNHVLLTYSFIKSKSNKLILPKDRRIIEFPPKLNHVHVPLISLSATQIDQQKKKLFNYEVEYKEFFTNCEFQDYYR